MWGALADPDQEKKVKGTDGVWRLDPGIVIARRRRRLGRWAANGRWYIDGLLLPVFDADRERYGLPPVQIHPLLDTKPTTLECAFLSRPLGEVVTGIESYDDLPERIGRATEYHVRLALDFDKRRVACRQVVVVPASRGGVVTSVHPIPTGEIVRQIFGGLVEKYERQRPLDAIAREVAEVYLAAPATPALAVAEHFGWRTPGEPWITDDRARAKVRRAGSRAEKLGYLPARSAGGRPATLTGPQTANPIRRKS
jgi:hypothetical protein